MSGIDNHDKNEYITTAEALALFKKLQLEEQNQRNEGLHGADLPLEISEYLDGTPAYELKEELKRFKRQIEKYKNDVAGNDETMSTNFSQAEFKDETSRMAVIRQIQQNEGLSQETMQFLGDAQRSGTQRTYDTEFLIAHQHFSTQHLNTIRSAIGFFISKRNKPVPIPADHKFKTWDIDIVIHYIKDQYSNNQMISLTHLQQKTIVLICIATIARPRSDVGKLLYQDVRLQTDDQGGLLGANIHFRLPKESQLKSCALGVIEDTTICPVHTLSAFVKRTENLRNSLPTDHTLFLAYIEDNLKLCGVRASTVANWVKDMMKKAGIDTTKYGPHSIRSAASTKAIEKGHTIEEVKEHANWSRNTQTFERFYYKPTNKESLGARISNSIFSTENLTTLEAGAEATEIVVGDVYLKLSHIVYDIEERNISIMKGVLMLTQMADTASYYEQRLLMGLARLIEELPKTSVKNNQIGETELWSSYFHPLFQGRPDAIISQVMGNDFGISFGFGECKTSDDCTNAALCFDIVFYMANLSNEGIYTFSRLAMMEFPRSVEELPKFINMKTISQLLQVSQCFWNHCYTQEHCPYLKSKMVQEVDYSALNPFIHSKYSNTCPCPIKFANL
ncbi:hypothetical protein G6F42_011034 [Rhizopus arrhizus]|nr:hypothetical protein G6F42_011034 [Rhizopus arrhizus]